MSEELKRWTSKRKATLVIEIFKGQTTISEAARQYDLTPSEYFSAKWLASAKKSKRLSSSCKSFSICDAKSKSTVVNRLSKSMVLFC